MAKLKIELDVLEHVDQLRVSEAMVIKQVSSPAIYKQIKLGKLDTTPNNLIINNKRFKDWKPRRNKR